jgi:hypothetical protein
MTQETKLIDAQTAWDLVSKAVADRGEEHVYPGPLGSCMYVLPRDITEELIEALETDSFKAAEIMKGMAAEELASACIVGHALYLHGVPIGDMLADSVVSGLADHLLARGWEIDVNAQHLLTRGQRIQDSGESWGAALAAMRQVAIDLGLQV